MHIKNMWCWRLCLFSDYRYKKDEIFKRMKVTTFVQLVSGLFTVKTEILVLYRVCSSFWDLCNFKWLICQCLQKVFYIDILSYVKCLCWFCICALAIALKAQQIIHCQSVLPKSNKFITSLMELKWNLAYIIYLKCGWRLCKTKSCSQQSRH